LAGKYPDVAKDDSLRGLKKKLTGPDDLIWRVCKDLSLQVSLRVVYDTYDELVMTKKPADLSDWFGAAMGESVRSALMKYHGGKTVIDDIVDGEFEDPKVVLVRWVVPLTENATVRTSYAGYGHKASVSRLHGDVCLFVRVPDADSRMGGEVQKGDSSDESSDGFEDEDEEQNVAGDVENQSDENESDGEEK
jgi:hypothetical protein